MCTTRPLSALYPRFHLDDCCRELSILVGCHERVGVEVHKVAFDHWSSAYFRRTTAWAPRRNYVTYAHNGRRLSIDNEKHVCRKAEGRWLSFTKARRRVGDIV